MGVLPAGVSSRLVRAAARRPRAASTRSSSRPAARAQLQLAAVRARDRAADRQADAGAALRRAVAAARAPVAALEDVEDPLAPRRLDARARSRTAKTMCPPWRRTVSSTGAGGSLYFNALSIRFSSSCENSRASQRTSGRPGSAATLMRRSGSSRRRPVEHRADDLLGRLPVELQRTSGASRRTSCSVLSVRRLSRRVSSTMPARGGAAARRSGRRPVRAASDAAPMMAASGVR